MSLNRLESAWRQLRLQNSLDNIPVEDILLALEVNSTKGISFTRILLHGIVFLTLTICFQGG